jgi:CPA2 family monovalent cation:H+ antiporter-2
VVADELEGIVALFSEVLADYRVSADEILRYEEAIRGGSYAALEESGAKEPVPPCTPGKDCFSTRSVGVRAGAPIVGRTWEELGIETRLGVRLLALERRGAGNLSEPARQKLLPGDEAVIEGSPEAFPEVAPLFAAFASPAVVSEPAPQKADWIDTGKPVVLVPKSGSECGHLGEIREVYPSAAGCEDCLRTGDRWVHLRACMICGHIGCCDSSPNRHATKHYETTAHPVIRSMERGESWGWCYVDGAEL